MTLKDWTPKEGWRMERAVEVTDCPYCREPSEFYLCDVFGCSNTELVAGFLNASARRHVQVCGKHAWIAYGETKDGPTEPEAA